MLSHSDHGTVFLLFLAFCTCSALIQIYGLFRFRSLRHLVVIQRRYPALVQMECIALLLLLFTNSCWSHALLCESHSLPWYLPIDWYLAIDFITCCLAHFVAEIEALRLYLICYDLQWTRSLKNQRWKTLIDTSYTEKDWYLRNRDRWGNKHYVFKQATILHLIGFTIRVAYMGWVFLQPRSRRADYIYVFDAVLFCFPILLINWSYFRAPKRLNDCLFFHFEVKATIIAYIATYVVFVCSLTALVLLSGNKNEALVLSRTVIIGCAKVPSLISTIYIPHKIQISPIWVCDIYSESAIIRTDFYLKLHIFT